MTKSRNADSSMVKLEHLLLSELRDAILALYPNYLLALLFFAFSSILYINYKFFEVKKSKPASFRSLFDKAKHVGILHFQ